MNRVPQQRTSVSALIGTQVLDAAGHALGQVRELAVAPTVDAGRVEALIVRRSGARRRDPMLLLPIAALAGRSGGPLRLSSAGQAAPMPAGDDYLLLDRDLLDQQIIDVHGHKVVRVNDVDLVWDCAQQTSGSAPVLRIAEVEVGLRGAVRRLLKGLPAGAVDSLSCRIPAAVIPWEFVDLIDRDPARRVRLKIEQERLSKMHPSDLADILEELATSESQALFSSLDEEVAAEALEEVEPRTQKSLIEKLDSERVAGIIEEMDPAAAADLLSELSEERSDAILEEMGEKERHEIEELLEYQDDTAAGLMTTDFIAVPQEATAGMALEALAAFDGDLESVTDIFLLTAEGELAGSVPLGRLALATLEQPLAAMHEGHMVSSDLEASGKRVAELFDKYNLRCLPVLDEEKKLAGVIHAEDVITWLRTGR